MQNLIRFNLLRILFSVNPLSDSESLQLREVSRKSCFKCIGYAYDNNQGYAKSSA